MKIKRKTKQLKTNNHIDRHIKVFSLNCVQFFFSLVKHSVRIFSYFFFCCVRFVCFYKQFMFHSISFPSLFLMHFHNLFSTIFNDALYKFRLLFRFYFHVLFHVYFKHNNKRKAKRNKKQSIVSSFFKFIMLRMYETTVYIGLQ